MWHTLYSMISRQYRFHGHGSLRYVSKNATAIRSKWFAVKALPNRFRKHTRIAVVVSRKIHKRAVVRNRIRRRVYEILRQELPRLSQVYDIVVIVTSIETSMAPADELRATLLGQLDHSGVYKSDIIVYKKRSED